LIKREKFISKPVQFAYRIDTKILYSFRFIRFHTCFYYLMIRIFLFNALILNGIFFVCLWLNYLTIRFMKNYFNLIIRSNLDNRVSNINLIVRSDIFNTWLE